VTQHATYGTMMDRAYTYSAAGDIETIDDAVTGNTRYYEYDQLHRLISEHSSVDDYSYLTPSILDYSYSADKPLHGVGQIDSLGVVEEFAYDANGNMTSAPDFSDPDNPAARTISYNMDNMPTTIVHSQHGSTNIVYDGNGSRAKKSGPNGDTYYYGAHFENQGGVLVKYIFAGGQRVAMIKSGETFYFHKDHLGSSTLMTDADGSMVEASDYLPFGGQRGDGIVLSNYGFTDQERDPESGLYNYNARLYDPAIAVFITADTIVPDPGGSQAFNRYAYCINNPLIYVDPSGHDFGLSAMIAGAVIGAVSAGAQSDWDARQMVIGAVIGAVSSGAGQWVYEAGYGATAAMAASSTVSSAGWRAASRGQSDIATSFGIANYNWSSKELGYLGQDGNSSLQNIGFTIGAIANWGDVGRLLNNSDITLYVEKDSISHAALVDDKGKTITSWGPESYWKKGGTPTNIFKFATEIGKGRNDWKVYKDLSASIKNVNPNFVGGASAMLSKIMPFQGLTTNCVNMASFSLLAGGVPNIGIHPYLLYYQMKAREAGFYIENYSHYLQERKN
jgi:RHS repeat-associated protein